MGSIESDPINKRIEEHQEPSGMVFQAAERLALLCFDMPQFQAYLVAQRALKTDAQVALLREQYWLLGCSGELDDPGCGPGVQADDLKKQYNALRVVQEYQRAKRKLQEIFSRINQSISDSANINFAEEAQPDGCG